MPRAPIRTPPVQSQATPTQLLPMADPSTVTPEQVAVLTQMIRAMSAEHAGIRIGKAMRTGRIGQTIMCTLKTDSGAKFCLNARKAHRSAVTFYAYPDGIYQRCFAASCSNPKWSGSERGIDRPHEFADAHDFKIVFPHEGLVFGDQGLNRFHDMWRGRNP